MSEPNNSSNSAHSSNRMSEEIAAEQSYVSMLYGRLDVLRERTQRRLRDVHGGPTAENDQAMSERQSFHELHVGRLAQLSAVERGLAFGRLDGEDRSRTYIGRLGLFDEDYEPLLVDWRTPMAQAFYRATPTERLGVVRRRHLRTSGRRVVGIEDDLLDIAALEESDRHRLSGEAALLASLAAGRTGRMSDIVATIQAEQDEVIRSDLAGILVVEGGPGTGKTVVALHRAAYLLYTHRERLANRGILIVGPNPTFMRYIDQVLPSLGETEAVLATVGELYPGVVATGQDRPETESVKGDARMVGVLAAAVRDRQQVPAETVELVVEGESYVLMPRTCERARERARQLAADTGEEPHNRARRYFVRTILDDLTQQAVDRLGGDLLGAADLADIRTELASAALVHEVLNRLWPDLTPEQLLTDLYASTERLEAAGMELSATERAALLRPGGHPWAAADIPLLDEAAEMLGELDLVLATQAAAEQQREEVEAEEVRLARETLELLGMLSPDQPSPETVATRYRESRRRDSATDGAMGDREWAYGHVIVDEAQELSPMAWRMLMRRCPARSMTVVGDLAQASAAGGARSWAQALDPHAKGRWRQARLNLNYRTPAAIMAVADGVLARIDPDLRPPRSVREGGAAPWLRRVEPGELARVLPSVVAAEVDALAARDDADEHGGADAGRVAVLVPSTRRDEVARCLADLGPGTVDPEPGGPGEPGEPGPGEQASVDLGSGSVRTSVLDARVSVLTVAQAKGLEFDAVVVVDPVGLLAESARGPNDLYVALTRATARLGVVTTGPVPDLLSALGTPG